MKNIYFIRHSIRDTSVEDDLTAPLTEAGLVKAQQLAPFFNGLRIDEIYSSPALRSIQTITPITQTAIQKDDALLERQIGKWVEDFAGFARRQWDDFDYCLPGGESLNDVRKRMLNFYQRMIHSTSQNIIVAGHGTAFAVLFNALTNDFNYNEWQNMSMPDVYKLSLMHEEIISFERLGEDF